MIPKKHTFYVYVIRQEEVNYCDYGNITTRISESPDLYRLGYSISDGVSNQGTVKAIIPVEWLDEKPLFKPPSKAVKITATHRVEYWEYERGSGSECYDKAYFTCEADAVEEIKRFNSQNKDAVVPDYYTVAKGPFPL